jgi:hypothetical protein
VAGLNSGNSDNSLAGCNSGNSVRERKDHAGASEKSPLDMFAEAEAPRRRRRGPAVAHLRYGRLHSDVERSLELERPELLDLDEAELERLFAKHSDIAEGRCS